ncbi:pyridoxamine 5'-phosphate oxidase family protein [Marinobacter adhaerens]|uniref:Pyridoxamine 5'-phosphate oxidase family protein n=1 Tax=Marinobacter adhaerens TaxID=1033846 RepID=A0ABX8IIM9_9GAMM|nr:pyridoxamine 5'-phosphate oxidase family protein [Marinobacter adhaerens]MBW4976967.1 pyridoxamine 5'-phosphate oxidase family protein [Marinobacter adhaerens]MCK5864420.1 pyridoxamine 5'-phosphate oxidase family protein [Marinobacter adhaerens]QWV12519.1 pyridoxamine 5'-phosphate oxidase family protein [Marinobacter adhaerens]
MTTTDLAGPSASPLTSCPRSRVQRAVKRASYDRETAYRLIDRLKTAHLGFVEDGEPRIIPITAWRLGDDLYVHTLNGGRLSRRLESGVLLCISFAVTNEWVMTKSAFNHSANYESLVLYGHAVPVTDHAAFDAAFRAIINQIEPGRWEQVRAPNNKERKATALFRIPIDEGAFKSRTGGPNDDPEDMTLPVWHGLIPTGV